LSAGRPCSPFRCGRGTAFRRVFRGRSRWTGGPPPSPPSESAAAAALSGASASARLKTPATTSTSTTASHSPERHQPPLVPYTATSALRARWRETCRSAPVSKNASAWRGGLDDQDFGAVVASKTVTQMIRGPRRRNLVCRSTQSLAIDFSQSLRLLESCKGCCFDPCRGRPASCEGIRW
jgi:hypothetical protein